MFKINCDQIEKENRCGDIYYVVNTGGDKDKEITHFNAVFIDLDCGRDENKNYYPTDTVNKYKQTKLDELKEFPLEPTIIVETRNGLHVYWLLGDSCIKEDWIECENKLIHKFSSDEKVKNPARLLRVPFTYWMKDKNNKFLVSILNTNNKKYNIHNILDYLKDINLSNEKPKNDAELVKPNINTKSYYYYNDNIECIKKRDVERLHEILFNNNSYNNYKNECGGKAGEIDYTKEPYYIYPGKTPDNLCIPIIIVRSRSEMYNVIDKIDLMQFLGLITDRFHCIFHDDNSPSANIFVNKDNGHFLYKCHSHDCKFPCGNIIRVVERLQHCTKPQAINFIKEVYNIQLIESEWQKQQKEVLETNKEYLYSGRMEQEHPELYKRVKNYIPLLVMMIDICKMHTYDESLNEEDKTIFFASLSYIEKMCNTKSSRVNERINLFTFLALIEKLDEKEIPQKLIGMSKYNEIVKKQQKLVNYFSIPSYTDDVLTEAENMAMLFKEKNMTMTGFSRENLIRTFGENSEVVNRIYPQYKGVKLTAISNEITFKIHKIACELMNGKNYVLEKEILFILTQKYNKTMSEIQIKKSLQEMLDSYGWKRVRLNGDLKKQYNVQCGGYPFIILKE